VAEKAAKVTISTVKSALQSVIAPEMNEIKSSLKVLDTRVTEMDRMLDGKIDSLRSELGAEIKAVDSKAESQTDKH